jgi:hypothetical protein
VSGGGVGSRPAGGYITGLQQRPYRCFTRLPLICTVSDLRCGCAPSHARRLSLAALI